MPPQEKRPRSLADDNRDSDQIDLRTHEKEIATLKSRVEVLEEEIETLKGLMSDSDNVIVLRTIDRDVAKGEILELFQNGETLYFSDISKRLRLDLALVVEIVQELMEEGEIEINGDAV